VKISLSEKSQTSHFIAAQTVGWRNLNALGKNSSFGLNPSNVEWTRFTHTHTHLDKYLCSMSMKQWN